jgi:hypothetical protein
VQLGAYGANGGVPFPRLWGWDSPRAAVPDCCKRGTGAARCSGSGLGGLRGPEKGVLGAGAALSVCGASGRVAVGLPVGAALPAAAWRGWPGDALRFAVDEAAQAEVVPGHEFDLTGSFERACARCLVPFTRLSRMRIFASAVQRCEMDSPARCSTASQPASASCRGSPAEASQVTGGGIDALTLCAADHGRLHAIYKPRAWRVTQVQ